MKIESVPISEQLKMLKGGGSGFPSGGIEQAEGIGESEKMSFSELLGQQFNNANRLGIEAERSMASAVAGDEVEPHSTVIAVQKASISLTLMMSIKERLERAYQELIRTPLG